MFFPTNLDVWGDSFAGVILEVLFQKLLHCVSSGFPNTRKQMKAQGQTLEDSFEKTFKAPNTRKQRKAWGQTLEDSFEKTFGASSEIHFVMDLTVPCAKTHTFNWKTLQVYTLYIVFRIDGVPMKW